MSTERFSNRVAVITGAGTGIGAAVARRMAAEGAHLILVGRRPAPLATVCDEILSLGGRAEALPLDISDAPAVEQAMQALIDKHGHIDILVNNAMSFQGGLIAAGDVDGWLHNFSTTLHGAFYAMRCVMGHMCQRGSGAIVNVSSVSGVMASPGMAGYASAKAALIQLSRVAALEGARSNVRINAVVPGAVRTPAFESSIPDPAIQAAVASGIPMGRIAQPDEIANAICFLASDEASFITGAALSVDGGKSCELSVGSSLADASAN